MPDGPGPDTRSAVPDVAGAPEAAATAPSDTTEPAAADGGPAASEPTAADGGPTASEPTAADGGPAASEPTPSAASTVEQTSLAAPVSRGLTYAVDIVFCIDVTGSMDPIIDAVKANALRFYDDVQTNLTAKGKNVDELRVRVIAFRDFAADGEAAMQESPFYRLPDERGAFSDFVNGLIAEGGGDAPESGLEAVALGMNSPWTTRGDRRRQVVVVWTDQPANPLDPSVVPAELRARVPADFSALTDLWEDTQGPLGASSKRLILFAPDGPGWSDISAVWENVVHHPSQAGGGLSDVDYGTIIDSIGNSV
jgi:hypothetical protein